mgnify:CR=1 FL=1
MAWKGRAGNVLTGLEINTALVAERVVLLKEYPFIGVMGYAAGENPFMEGAGKAGKRQVVAVMEFLIRQKRFVGAQVVKAPQVGGDDAHNKVCRFDGSGRKKVQHIGAAVQDDEIHKPG